MPISVATYIQPKNATHSDPAMRNLNYVVEDIYFKGGYQVRANSTERDAIVAFNRKAGMAVLTLDTYKIWLLNTDLTTWVEFKSSGGGGGTAIVGSRNQLTHLTAVLQPAASEDFTLMTGSSIIANKIQVSGPSEVAIFGDALYKDTNPFTFVAIENHLIDDGSWFAEDGTQQFGRRYSVIMNSDMIQTPNLYFRITNLQDIAVAIQLDIEFLSVEA